MSFQLNTATALPAEVQLAKEKPQGAFCLRTRYALSANSANSWSAGTLVSLPLQTGTPGTFTDVKQGTINCTLQILNTNPYVDFLNFGPCGAIIFFEEMRVYSSGTPVEENLRYSESVDLLMMQGGYQNKPYHVFRRNNWRAANGRAGDKHINFIKPSMVDSTGAPMFGRTPFMDKNSAVYCPPSIAFGFRAAASGDTADTPATTRANQVVDWSYKAAGVLSSTGANSVTGQIVGLDGGTFTDYFLPTKADGKVYSDATPFGLGQPLGGRNPSHTAPSTAATTIGKSDMLAFKNTQVGRTAPAAASQTSCVWLPAAQYVPSQWPDYQPSTLCGEVDDDEIDSLLGKTKISEYMKYLANVRSLPIGVKGKVNDAGYHTRADTDVIGNNVLSYNVDNVSRNLTEYRVSMPFLSGIYGILADKMFPDLLIGANNIRIEFKLASNQKAFWLTMDPCRRVPGTVRDFVPFTGSGQGQNRSVDPATIATNSGLVKYAAGTAALGCTNFGVNLVTLATTAVVQNAVDTSQIIAYTQMYTTDSALGLDLVPITLSQAGAAIATSNMSANPAEGFHMSPFSNLPKPQYVPTSTPWLDKTKTYAAAGDLNKVTYVNENASCYGTYLPASVPQTRRCQKSSRLNVSDNFNSVGSTSFAIKDLQYIGEQVQLDDISASAIINHAASAEIVVWTKGYRSFEANCDANEQQNIILPIQIGQATAMYLLFRPSVILQSQDYYSNSFVCPFVGLGFDNTSADVAVAGAKPDVGGKYTLYSSLDTSSMGAFSYQLFAGAKQYPLQPIQTVPELIAEREKSTHSLHNWAWSGSENMQITKWGVNYGPSQSTGFTFDPFLDLGYFTTFVPVAALDDQTITANPYFALAESLDDTYGISAATTRIRGRRAPAAVTTTTVFQGVLNKYVPPIGAFYLGWDFESWTNHDDLMRTGKFLGQEQLSVRLTGCKLMSSSLLSLASVDSSSAVTTPIGCTAIVPHIVKLSFVPGGHMLSYY